MKATRVDGVYSADPEMNPHAERYDRLTFAKVIHDKLKVMDLAAFDLCQAVRLPILVFNYKAKDAIGRAVAGQAIGTVIRDCRIGAGPRPRERRRHEPDPDPEGLRRPDGEGHRTCSGTS